jgi:hypothetical protein
MKTKQLTAYWLALDTKMNLIYKIADQILRYSTGQRLVIREGNRTRDLYSGKYKVNGAIKNIKKQTHSIKCHHWTGEEYIINL